MRLVFTRSSPWETTMFVIVMMPITLGGNPFVFGPFRKRTSAEKRLVKSGYRKTTGLRNEWKNEKDTKTWITKVHSLKNKS